MKSVLTISLCILLLLTISSCNDFEKRVFKFSNSSSFDLELNVKFGLYKNYKVAKNKSITYFEYWASERPQDLDSYPLAAEKITILLSDGRKIEESTCELLKQGQFGCDINPEGFFSKKYFVGISKRKNNVGLEFIFTDEFAKTAK